MQHAHAFGWGGDIFFGRLAGPHLAPGGMVPCKDICIYVLFHVVARFDAATALRSIDGVRLEGAPPTLNFKRDGDSRCDRIYGFLGC